jgi:hypothetical protein
VLLFSLLLGNPLLRVCVHLRVSLFLALCCVEGSQRSLRLLDGRTDMALIVYSFRVRFYFFIFFSLFVSSSWWRRLLHFFFCLSFYSLFCWRTSGSACQWFKAKWEWETNNRHMSLVHFSSIYFFISFFWKKKAMDFQRYSNLFLCVYLIIIGQILFFVLGNNTNVKHETWNRVKALKIKIRPITAKRDSIDRRFEEIRFFFRFDLLEFDWSYVFVFYFFYYKHFPHEIL